MSMIQVSHLTFGYEGSFDNIFEDVSFQIDTDWKLGFIGRNGRGKTTFLNLLLGRYEYTGTITHSVEFEYFPYPVEDREEMTLTILEGIAPEVQLWEIQRELSLLEVEEGVLYRPFSTLSNGEQTKTLLAALFLKENRFLLIDEPTNHLDTLAREKVGEYLAGKKGFILVSHDRAFLDRCVDHVLSINRADIEVQRGNYSSWQQNKDRQDQRELAENEQLKKDIKRLEQAARRTAGWSDAVEKTKKGTRNAGLRPDRGFIGHKAAKMMKRAKSIEARREDAAQEKAELLHNLEQAGRLKLPYTPYYKETLLEATDLSLFYGEKIAVKEVSFTVKRGERVALVGRNGSGKSSILKFLLGEEVKASGTLRMGSGLMLSYVPQDTSSLAGEMRAFIQREGLDESLFKAILRKLDFSRAQLEKPLEALSQGQKKKILLARSLCQPAHLYIWDEPLNYVDLISRTQIEVLIEEFQPTMLFVEHDRMFCEKVATKQVLLG